MAKKIKLTRPELKRQRDALARFERYLPMLKLKQQQLQLTIRQVKLAWRKATAALDQAKQAFDPYRIVLKDTAGVNVRELSAPAEVRTDTDNVAGVNIPIFVGLDFPTVTYSLFATPPWVDRALADMRKITACRVECDILRRQRDLLQAELTKIIQRVNLFEKVKIPEAREAIRLIRIRLGDEMTAAVGRAKIAKAKLTATEHVSEDSTGMTEPAAQEATP